MFNDIINIICYEFLWQKQYKENIMKNIFLENMYSNNCFPNILKIEDIATWIIKKGILNMCVCIERTGSKKI